MAGSSIKSQLRDVFLVSGGYAIMVIGFTFPTLGNLVLLGVVMELVSLLWWDYIHQSSVGIIPIVLCSIFPLIGGDDGVYIALTMLLLSGGIGSILVARDIRRFYCVPSGN